MADTNRRLDFLIAAKDQASKDIDRVSGKVQDLKRQLAAPMPKGFFEQLGDVKKTFGRRGPFGDIAELAVGGGAVAGLTFAFNGMANALEGVNAEMVKFKNTGVIAWDEIQRSILRAVPVVGHFADALLKVAETYVEIQLRAKEGIPLPQGPAGQGARAEQSIIQSQGGLARVTGDIDFQRKSLNADEHQKRLLSIDKEFEERKRTIDAAREMEIQAIIKARGLGQDEAGRRAAGAALGGRQIDFTQAEIDAARLRDEQRKKAEEEERKRRQKAFQGAVTGTGGILGDVFGGLFGKAQEGAKGAAAGIAGGLFGLFSGMAGSRGGGLAAVPSTSLATLTEGRGTGQREAARDRLNSRAFEVQRENSRRLREQAERVKENTEAAKALTDTIKNWKGFFPTLSRK